MGCLCCWPGKAVGCPPIRWRSHESLLSLVIDFLFERIEAAASTETLSESALYSDYATWCRASGREALSAAAFVEGFDRLRARKWPRQNPQTKRELRRHPPRHLLISRDSG